MDPDYQWIYNAERTLVVRVDLHDQSFRWYFNEFDIQGFMQIPSDFQNYILNGVGARASVGSEPGVVGFYDDTIRGWTPSLAYNMFGISKGIIESTDTGISYDNYHEWEEPDFNPYYE